MNSQLFLLRQENARDRMAAAWKFACRFLELGQSAKVVVSECKPKRSLEQNDKMWAILTEISQQVIWYGQKLPAEDWKDIFTASLRKARVVPGIDAGSFVPLGMRTSDMSKDELALLIELMQAFAAEQGVTLKEPDKAVAA